jgi:predicted transcriptional regulator
MEITAKHLKSARIWLGWSQKDLVEKSGVSLPTIQRMEATKEGSVRGNYQSVTKVESAMEAAGIQLIDDERGMGVVIDRYAQTKV